MMAILSGADDGPDWATEWPLGPNPLRSLEEIGKFGRNGESQNPVCHQI